MRNDEATGGESARAAVREPIYLASQLASICDVDLKTIHNWCDRPAGEDPAGVLECFRTPGGHLRFRHSAVLRFLARWGYPIPDALLRDRPHLMVVEPEDAQRKKLKKALGLVRPGEEDAAIDDEDTLGLFCNARWYVHLWNDPYAALVSVGERAAAGATPDLAALAIPLEGIDESVWMAAVARRPATASMRFVLMAAEGKPSSMHAQHAVAGVVPRGEPGKLAALLDDQGALMMAERGAARAGAANRRRVPIAPREPIYVASQVASIWDVDLKTVHNWVERGDIEAFSTPGRHLRFRRRSLLHFLRRYNMTIPSELAPIQARVLVVDPDARSRKRLQSLLVPTFDVLLIEDPVEALAELGAQCSGAGLVDGAVVRLPVPGIDEKKWVAALGRHPDTRYTRVVVVFDGNEEQRAACQELGAIATVEPHALEQVPTVLERALGLGTSVP